MPFLCFILFLGPLLPSVTSENHLEWHRNPFRIWTLSTSTAASLPHPNKSPFSGHIECYDHSRHISQFHAHVFPLFRISSYPTQSVRSPQFNLQDLVQMPPFFPFESSDPLFTCFITLCLSYCTHLSVL